MKSIEIDWQEPEQIAQKIYYNKDHEDFVFLHSSRNDKFDNGFTSIIAFDKYEEITKNEFLGLKDIISENNEKFDNCWFGYLAYDLKNTLEDIYEEQEKFIEVPNIVFKKFKNIIVFNHKRKSSKWFFKDNYDLGLLSLEEVKNKDANINILNFTSNMTDEEYLSLVSDIRKDIIEGTYYEANFTRKFYGEVKAGDKFAMYLELAKKSPAQYGAFIKFNDLYIISSSPESFLKSDNNGNITAQPIKGTIGIDTNDGEKEKIKLMNSDKDKAENLMIVDLMRNDLSISCEVGSVKVPKIFEITSYPHLHHLSSVITGKKRKNVSNVDLIQRCFPPGSMTGAPKVSMMNEISKKEKFKRGVYSGAIGYFGGDGSFDFSVVIRTILIKENKLEFQVGGAIVYDSTPEEELVESNVKAQKIKELLGL